MSFLATASDGANADLDNLIFMTCEAKLLFSGEGRAPAFAPGAASRAMPGLREQRKAGQFCDVVFRTADGAEVWGHQFVMASKFLGCNNVFNEAKMTRKHDQEQQEWMPPICVVVRDISSEMLELLVDFAYHAPLNGRVGLHNVDQVLDMAETYNVSKICDHCINMLKQNLDQDSCVKVYRLATTRRYSNLAAEAFRYLARHLGLIWNANEELQSLSPEELRAILIENRLQAPNEVKHTFRAILKWISSSPTQREKYLAAFLPLVRFLHCTASYFDRIVSHPQVHTDGNSIMVLKAIYQSLPHQSTTLGECAGVDLSAKLWLKLRTPNHILFLFGGCTAGVTNKLHTFNSRTCTWRLIVNQFTPRRLGGFTRWEILDTIEFYDPSTDVWTRLLRISTPRCGLRVIAQKDSIYLIGGNNGVMRLKAKEWL